MQPLPLRSVLLLFAVVLTSIAIAADDARDRFYSWPPGPDFPTAMQGEFWDWLPADAARGDARDRGDAASLLDLRHLNEPIAGQDGWVHRRGDKLYLGKGEPVRFWAVNMTASSPLPVLEDLTRYLAGLGVNMIRIHGGASKSLLDFKSGQLDRVNFAVIDQMHRAVAAAKKAGIYTFVSNSFFIIEMKVKASYGLEGYTQAWLDAHPDHHIPFGLIFLNDRFRGAFKEWLRVFATTPNPYDPERTPLAADRSVGVFELLNEDNLFFFTFDPARWPVEQQVIAGQKFHRWLAAKYQQDGDSPDGRAAVQRALAAWNHALPGDDPARGTLALASAAQMAQDQQGGRRLADQIEFLGEVQRGFHAEMTALLREAGYGGLVSASNWKTSDDRLLLDLEFATYREGDIVDRHAYYAPPIARERIKHRIGVGDAFLGFSILANPAGSPTNVRQMTDYPSAMSEFAWVNYNPAGVEAPLVSAAYFSMADFDLPVWFALHPAPWSHSMGKWAVGRPSVLGQFPGAALLFRRGDVAEAPVVVREGRTLDAIYRREPARIMPGRGFDATRDDPLTFDPARATARGTIDPLAMMAGKVVMTYADDRDEISPELTRLINRAEGRVTSITGQLVTDWRHGLFTVNTSRSQGVSGFLRANERIELGDVIFTSENAFGALLAISLDDRPLSQSEKIMIQVGAIDRLTGFETKPVKLEHAGGEYAGHEIVAGGGLPWQVERIDALVTLKGAADRVHRVTALDENGRARHRPDGQRNNGDFILRLPPDALYTIIELSGDRGGE